MFKMTMPNFDGTGPDGQGAFTGRGKGKCPDKTNQKKTLKTNKKGGDYARNGWNRS